MASHAAIHDEVAAGALARTLTLTYGLTAYALFFGTFLYLIGFIGGFGVPKTLDSGVPGPIGMAIAVNLGLLALFAIQHTIMARCAFKRWWTTIIPEQVERSTFVLVTSLLLCLMAWQWRPIPGVVWQVEGPAAIAIHAISAIGWLIVLGSTFIIDHFDLFGLRQGDLPVSLLPPPADAGLPDRLLGDAHDEREPPALRRGVHRLHPGSDQGRGEDPDPAARLGLRGLPASRSRADSAPPLSGRAAGPGGSFRDVGSIARPRVSEGPGGTLSAAVTAVLPTSRRRAPRRLRHRPRG
jgi:protein-S-isoprenylcysteine O-methyltransferase Ste14